MTAFERLGAGDFQAAMLRLLPRGRAWPRAAGTVLAALCGAAADLLAALHARAVALLGVEADPTRAVELLAEFEAQYGLPDICTPPGSTMEQRHAAIAAKMQSTGGQSIAYFVAVAAAMGYTITVTEWRPFRVGVSAVGVDPVVDAPWAHAWLISVPAELVQYFRVGVAAVGEPLWVLNGAAMPCRLARIAPAHTVLVWQFGGPITAPLDDFTFDVNTLA